MTPQIVSSPGLARTVRDVALWGVATYGVLRLSALPGDGGAKVLCGPWGCLPPLQALAAAHGFWLMVIAPMVAWAGNRLSTGGLVRTGRALVAIGGLGLVAIVIHSVMTWGPVTPGRTWWHPILHAAFDVAMLVDVPMVELVAAGMACVAIARARNKRAGAGRSDSTGAGVPGNPGSTADWAEGRTDEQPT